MGEILKELPAVILRGSVLLPGVVSHFDISTQRSIHAVEAAMNDDNHIFLVTQKDMQTEHAKQEDVYATGVVAEIKQIVKMQNHVVRVIVESKQKAELAYFIEKEEFLKAQVVLEEEENVQEQLPPEVEEAMLRSLQEKLLSYCTSNPKIGKELKKQAEGLNKLKSFIQVVGGTLPLGYEKRQELLEADSLTAQYEILMKILLYETNIQQIKNELQEKVKERIDQNQREYILREEMKVIREELGEDNTTSDIRQFEESLEKLEADDTVKERIRKEIARFKNVANSPSEGSVVRGYIETLLDLPWNKKSVDNTDLKNAEQILNDDHYGLEKVKELFEKYAEIDEETLFENLVYFLNAIMPVCDKYDINMAIHPDDPAWPVFGLPRIVRSKEHIMRLLNRVDNPHNGLTFCTGSFGSNPDNDLVDMIYAAKGRIHFAHVRNIKYTGDRQFEEAAHLSSDGSLDMYAIMKALYDTGFDGPIRPDHGRMIWDEKAMPGYGLYDRALGAAYLNGIWESLNKESRNI